MCHFLPVHHLGMAFLGRVEGQNITVGMTHLSLYLSSFWGDSHAHQFDIECGIWSLFNICSNADSTPTPIFQRKHLDVMLSTCAQLLWTTYPRPVLSGPRSFKSLDDLSHCAAAQFQGVENLLVAWPSSCSATIRLLRSSDSSLPRAVILELSVTSMREWESCTTNLNAPAPYAHGPSNTWAE